MIVLLAGEQQLLDTLAKVQQDDDFHLLVTSGVRFGFADNIAEAIFELKKAYIPLLTELERYEDIIWLNEQCAKYENN